MSDLDLDDAPTSDGKPRPNSHPEITDAVGDATYRVTSAELRQFIERYERLEAENKDIAEQKKEVMAEARSRGYDTKILRKVIAIRKQDANQRAEEEAVLDMYLEAMGIL